MVSKSAGTLDSFFGREKELDELQESLEAAARGEGRLYLIGGEPGIGKSRLADVVSNRGGVAGATVLWGKCWEGGGAPPYWPWIQCLRTYLRSQEPDTLRSQLGTCAADIVQMLPEVEQLVPDLPPLPSVDPESARFQLFDSTATFLRNAADAGVLVMVIDDLHAIDTASLLFLRFLAGQLGDMKMLLMATYRDVELTPDHPLTSSITDLSREPTTRHLLLGGLTEPDVALLVEMMGGAAPSPALVSALHNQTSGNPLFVSETVKMLTTEGSFDSAIVAGDLHVSIPGAVREVILRRLDQVGETCRDTMTLASVLGHDFGIEELRRLADRSAEEIAEVVDEAVHAGLLVETSGGHGRFRFSHDLVREVLYNGIAPRNRARLHWTAGEILEDLHAADLDGFLAEIAHHYSEGATAGDASKAVKSAREAANHSISQLAYEEAARLYQMAFQATELRGSVDPVEQGELLLALGDAQARGNLAGARETFRTAFDLARKSGEARLAGKAALGYGGRLVWARAGSDPHLIPLLQDALVTLGGDDDAMRARLLARLAGALRDSPDREHRASLSKQAVDLARRLGDTATLVYALDGRVFAIWWPENPGERLDLLAELRQLAAEIHDVERMVDGHTLTWGSLLELGSVQEAKAEIETVRRFAEELRQPAQRWLADVSLALTLLMEGRFAQAESLIEYTLHMDPTTPVRDNVSAASFQLFLMRREQGRVDEVEELVRASVEEFPSYPLHRQALALLLLDLDQRAEAKAIFGQAARDDFAVFHRDNMWLLGISLAAETCWKLGDEAAAVILYEQLIPFSGGHAVGLGEGSLGAVDRYLGLLASLLGKDDDAERHFGDAIAMNERMGARPWVAHCQHDLAVLLLSRDRDEARARGLLGEVLATATELGMVVLEGKIRPLLGDEVDTPVEPDGPVSEGVFRREGDYWSVAFEGREVRIRDLKGMRHLARLLAEPGREFHVLDLVSMEEGTPERLATPDSELTAAGLGDAGEVLDPQAKAAYRQRMAELEEDLAEAEEWNDPERVSRVNEEIEFLTRELAGAVGLAGRDRKTASAAERARLNVSRAIRSAISRIAENHPELGEHLDATINTGNYCSYTPDPRLPPTWSI
jgi:tetratricopeptide (TPR) repeat protein